MNELKVNASNGVEEEVQEKLQLPVIRTGLTKQNRISAETVSFVLLCSLLDCLNMNDILKYIGFNCLALNL